MTPRAGKLVRPGCAVPTRLLSVRLCFFPYTLRGDRVLVARQSVYHRTPCPRIEYIRSPVVAALVRSLVTSARCGKRRLVNISLRVLPAGVRLAVEGAVRRASAGHRLWAAPRYSRRHVAC